MGETIGEVVAKLGFPWDHIEFKCDGNHYSTSCMFCDGGLFACTECRSFEGATTTQCPKRNMTPEEIDKVYNGELDFRHGEWVRATSYYCPSGLRQLDS